MVAPYAALPALVRVTTRGLLGARPSRSAVLECVEPNREGDRQPTVDATVAVAREVEDVAVAQLELSAQMAGGLAVDEQVEVVRDRHPFAGRARSRRPAALSHRHAPLLCQGDLLLLRVEDPPRRADERLPEDVLQQPDPLFPRDNVVPSPADVEQGTRLDPKELFRLLLVGVATGRISWSTRNRWWLKPSEITAAILATIRPDQARSARQRSIRTTT